LQKAARNAAGDSRYSHHATSSSRLPPPWREAPPPPDVRRSAAALNLTVRYSWRRVRSVPASAARNRKEWTYAGRRPLQVAKVARRSLPRGSSEPRGRDDVAQAYELRRERRQTRHRLPLARAAGHPDNGARQQSSRSAPVCTSASHRLSCAINHAQPSAAEGAYHTAAYASQQTAFIHHRRVVAAAAFHKPRCDTVE